MAFQRIGYAHFPAWIIWRKGKVEKQSWKRSMIPCIILVLIDRDGVNPDRRPCNVSITVPIVIFSTR